MKELIKLMSTMCVCTGLIAIMVVIMIIAGWLIVMGLNFIFY